MCAMSFTPARGDAILAHVHALYRLACRLEDMDELNHRDGANYDDPNLKAASGVSIERSPPKNGNCRGAIARMDSNAPSDQQMTMEHGPDFRPVFVGQVF